MPVGPGTDREYHGAKEAVPAGTAFFISGIDR